MARIEFVSIALVAFVCIGFAIPINAAPVQPISMLGIWEGQCLQKYDNNYDCLPKGLVSTFPYYLNISQADGVGNYTFSVKTDDTIELGRKIATNATYMFYQGIQGDPNGTAQCLNDSDGFLPSFSIRLDHIGSNDVMTIESSQLVSDGQVCTVDHKPLYCLLTRGENTMYANQICVLYRKGGTQ